MSIRDNHVEAVTVAQATLRDIRAMLGEAREALDVARRLTASAVGDDEATSRSAAPRMIDNAARFITTTKGIILAAEDDLETYKDGL